MNNDYTMKVPKELREMAMKIEDWFIERGIDKWELMNICSRNHINDTESLETKIQQIKEML